MRIREINWAWKSVLQKRSATRLIILHHAAAAVCSAEQIDAWHKNNGWSGIGYHFFIRKNGEIYRGRPLWAVGAHTVGYNGESVGVCVEGNYSVEKSMPPMQKNSLRELLGYLKEVYPNAEIKGHKEMGATGCPGDYYPLAEMKTYFKNPKREGLSMTEYEELKAKDDAHDKIINTVGKEIDELKTKTRYYNKLADIPKWYRATIEKLIESGAVEGDENGDLKLTSDMMRILTILDRRGVLG